MKKRPTWFLRRVEGSGLIPYSREGWIALLVFLIFEAGGIIAITTLRPQVHAWVLFTWFIAWILVFLGLAYATSAPGE